MKWGNLGHFYIHLWAQILVHLQVQQFQILFALYVVNLMPLRTFMLLQHCLNRNWIVNMLWSWQILGEIYLFILVIMLLWTGWWLVILVLTAHFTTNVAQVTNTINLQKNRKKNVREKLILTMQKQQLWTRWLHLWTRLYHRLVKEGFDLHELENIYLDYLSEYKIW